MSKRDLDNNEYDQYLATKKHSRGAARELKQRHEARKNKGYEGWHHGLGDKPVKVRNKEEFKRELDKRGLMMKDDVTRTLR